MRYTKDIKTASVKIPRACRVFDCRGEHPTLDENGRTLYASDKAQKDLGFECTFPESIQGWSDMRECPEVADRAISRGIEIFKEYRKTFLKAKRMVNKPCPNGGSAYYKPIGICLSNYGVSLICDRRESFVIPF